MNIKTNIKTNILAGLLLSVNIMQAESSAELLATSSAATEKALQMKSYNYSSLNNAAKEEHIKALHQALTRAVDRSLKNLLISQLQICGGSESIHLLAKLLVEPDCSFKAATALQTISRHHQKLVINAVKNALLNSPAESLPAIIKLAGKLALSDADSLKKLLQCSGEQATRQSALEALACSGSELAIDTLSSSIVDNGYLRSRNIKLNLLLARRLPKALAKKHLIFVKSKIKKDETGLKLQHAALQIEIHNGVSDKLISELRSNNLKWASGLVYLLKTVQDKSLNKRIATALKEKPSAPLLLLCNLRDPELARPHLLKALSSNDIKIREISVKMAVALPVKQTVPVLMTLLMEQSDNRNIIATLTSLSPEASKSIRSYWKYCQSNEQRQALLIILAGRRDKHSASIFLSAARADDKALRKKALKGLKSVTSGNAPEIITLIQQSASKSEGLYAARALAEDLRNSPVGFNTVKNALSQNQSLEYLFKALALTDRQEAIALISPYLQNKDAKIRLLAIKSLSAMSLIDAGQKLLSSVQDKESKNSLMACRGVQTLALNSPASARHRQQLLKNLSAIAPAQEKAKVLAVLQQLSIPQNLAYGAKVSSLFKLTKGKLADCTDGDLGSSCWEGRGHFHTFVVVDLGKVCSVGAVHNLFPTGENDDYVYTLEYSKNGRSYQNLDDVSRRGSSRHEGGIVHLFTPVEARYIRLYHLKNLKTSNRLVRMRELRVFAPGKVPSIEGALLKQTGSNADENFTSLTEDKLETNWIKQGDYKLEQGLISGSKGRLMSKEQYADFHLKFDFKLSPGSNNGLAVRSPLKGRPIELQILDSEHSKYKKLKDYQYHGSLYNYKAAKRGFLKKAGQWNSEEVICKGTVVKVILNGTLIMEADLSMVQPIDATKYVVPYINKAVKGYIGFLGHNSGVQFKNIRIRRL